MKLIACIIVTGIYLNLASGQEHTIELEKPFHELAVTGNIHLVLVHATDQLLIIPGTGLPESLSMEQKDGLLTLKTKSELNNDPAIRMKLHYSQLSLIEINRGGRVQSADTLQVPILQLNVITGGKIECPIHVDSLVARVNQGADIILYGFTRSQTINAYSWGNFLGYELEAQNSYVKAATGAQVKVKSSVLLDANSTSKAFIGFQGTPGKKNLKTSVGGEITAWSE